MLQPLAGEQLRFCNFTIVSPNVAIFQPVQAAISTFTCLDIDVPGLHRLPWQPDKSKSHLCQNTHTHLTSLSLRQCTVAHPAVGCTVTSFNTIQCNAKQAQECHDMHCQARCAGSDPVQRSDML